MQQLDLKRVERELRRRCDFPYHWHVKQDNEKDELTKFIYECLSWDHLNAALSELTSGLQDYARNRWLNFWSAMAVEQIFKQHHKVEPFKNRKDRFVDFYLSKIPFDLKTTVFPRQYPHSVVEARAQPELLIEWLYRNQSREGSCILHNRLFLILYDGNCPEHWKLKAEIQFLKIKIESYLHAFHPQNLYNICIDHHQVNSDIIWCIED